MEIELNRFTPAEQATFRLRALYEQAGYRKYRASRFEEYALYQEYQRFLPDAQVITFTDLDGKLRAIKPDVTLSIAKTAQPAAGECKRFYYNEEVCRPSRESHTFQTIHQMGLESMGAVDADEQAAVVRLALQSLAALDVPTVLEISHMGYLTGLLDALHVPAEARAKLLDFLRAKNAHELRTAALAAGLDESAAAALTGLLDLHGPLGATLTAARAAPLLNGYAVVCRDGQFGLLDGSGAEFVPCTYDGLVWDGSTAWVKQNDGWHEYTIPGVAKPDPLDTLSGDIVAPDTRPTRTDTVYFQADADSSNRLNLRTGPGTEYDIIDRISSSTLRVYGYASTAPGWALVRYDPLYGMPHFGWVSTSYLLPAE